MDHTRTWGVFEAAGARDSLGLAVEVASHELSLHAAARLGDGLLWRMQWRW